MAGITRQFGPGLNAVQPGAPPADERCVDTARCPACSAVVRPDSDWCSLCYHDLRPPETLIPAASSIPSQPTTSETADGSSAPSVEALLEPGPVRWNQLPAWQGEVVEAQVHPQSDHSNTDQLQTNQLQTEQPLKSASEVLTWPCVCGTQVGFDHDECPTCGSPFLNELRVENEGRHRERGVFGTHWNESRAFRFAVAGTVAFMFAVVLPVLLTLLG